jgi:hypothetical protein
MARFRIWFRRRVRGLLRSSERKMSEQGRRKSTSVVPRKNIEISVPILVSHDGVNFELPATKPRPQSLPVQTVQETNLEQPAIHSSIDVKILPPANSTTQDPRSNSAPSTLVEEISAAPSLYEDSDNDDTIPEHLWPTTPTSPLRSSRRPSFIHIINAPSSPSYISRPPSFLDSNASESNEVNRYSVMFRESDRRSKRASIFSQLSSKQEKRASVLSQSSAKNRRRGSVISVGAGRNRFSGGEWEEDGRGKRFSRRMSWGFETYATHTSAYAPVRI